MDQLDAAARASKLEDSDHISTRRIHKELSVGYLIHVTRAAIVVADTAWLLLPDLPSDHIADRHGHHATAL